MGILLIPPRGSRDPLKSAALLLVLTVVFVFLADAANLQGNRIRLLELGGVLALVWLRFAGYLQLALFSRTFEVNIGQNRQVGYTKSALVGGAFALGWTPCIGPILGSIFTLAADSGDALRGTYLLVAYSAGLSLPFLIAGLALADVTPFLRRIQRVSGMFEVVERGGHHRRGRTAHHRSPRRAQQLLRLCRLQRRSVTPRRRARRQAACYAGRHGAFV